MFKKIIERISESKSFIITAHMNLEGDALGSELAMYAILRKMGKKVVVFNNDPTPHIYSFLPNVKVIKNDIGNQSFDTAIVLDCSDPYRTGKVKDYLGRAKHIINIDHHISNTQFGDLNWVEPTQSSTCQMLYKFCEKLKIMDKKIALCLYTGIFTDTGKFTYSNTNKDTHRIVSNLMKFNISPNTVFEKINSLCMPHDLEFIGKLIASLKFDQNRKICWISIEKWIESEYDLTEVVFSIMRLLKDVEVLLLFKRLDGNKVRINFRSRSFVDVNRVAKFFGGGGHKRASGTTVNGSLENVEKKVVSFIKKYTNGSKKKR
ncbi:MAG: bifunctional oligoribonuclease/PAP phosphatase NrnA [Candidatus Omnitrophica bacterium]|nr:bifunctional oligoribonuclease/PAP phosphatase NrnA [Candidatus Omnitrophota bacterium]